MLDWSFLHEAGEQLQARSGDAPPQIYDLRIDHDGLMDDPSPMRLRHVQHQLLMRTCQNRFVLLPSRPVAGSIVDLLHARYAPEATHRLDGWNVTLNDALIEPMVAALAPGVEGRETSDYIAEMLESIRNAPPSSFLAWLDDHPQREHHYRNFLIQSSADLLAEASASALGVVGEFGAPQSALFRILIDEFGYGTHDKKHSVLYRRTLRGFGLNEEYNGYWPHFDTRALELHNVIHYLFQSPRNLFRQIGFLLYAETSYQVSTGQHYRYLRRHHGDVDATYFGEHAHIDVHHSDMVINEVVNPLVARFGPDVGREVILGAELTRSAFAAADAHMLAVSKAFDAAEKGGAATYGAPVEHGRGRHLITPDSIGPVSGPAQVGGIGHLHEATLLGTFPEGATARELGHV